RQKQKKLIMLPSETMIWQPEFTDKTLSRKPGAVQKILDHMGSTELAANLFRATQTEEKLKRDGVNSKQQANTTHFDVGSKVMQTIQELGGTMPEELPTPQVSIKQLENSVKITEKK
ncbi:hypothetical protein ODT51_19600, partial [Escherichia coli]|nr:hypothetical protein [Escherichia coli]MCV8650034.1 hypothetical protein [Escherichia coli]